VCCAGRPAGLWKGNRKNTSESFMDGSRSDQTVGASGKAAKPCHIGQCVCVCDCLTLWMKLAKLLLLTHTAFHVTNSDTPSISPTDRIYVYCQQHYHDSLCNGDVLCSL
jgi:hypothetical protein